MSRLRRIPVRVPVLLVWFVVLWEALWGRFTLANLLSGVLVSLALVVIVRLPDAPLRSYGVRRFRPLRALWFLVYFAVKVVQANLVLAWEIITPGDHTEPGIIGVPLPEVSDAVVTLIANAFTLTPGSLTIEVVQDPTVVYVHVLHLHDPEKVRSELAHFAAIAVRAFGTEEAIAQFGELPARREGAR